MMSRRTPRFQIWPARFVAAALAVVVIAVAADSVQAQLSEEFVVRVAARMHSDGRIEFGIQRIDAQGTPRLLHLEIERFFPRDVAHHRWLHGDPTFLRQAPYYDSQGRDPTVPAGTRSAQARVIARVHPGDGRVEFALQPKLDSTQLGTDSDAYGDPIFAARRFFPPNVTHNRWLYSSEVRFTRVWTGDESMESVPTMEPQSPAGGTKRADSPSTPERCLADIAAGAMPDETCDAVMRAYSVAHPEVCEQYSGFFDWCRRRTSGG